MSESRPRKSPQHSGTSLTPLTPEERTQRSRSGAYKSWGNTPDRAKRTAPARAAMDRKFLEQAGGDVQRAEALRKAHYASLAFKSAVSRRRAKELLAQAEAAETELSDGAA
jgi:di/tripeptidase